MEKISIKPHFFTSDFLYELSYLINCEHFVNAFPSIIVIVTSKTIIFFVLMKKTQNFQCVLHNKLFNEFGGTVGGHFWLASEKFYFVTTWGFSRKNVLIEIISHNSAQFEKLNILIVCYITNHQNSWISKFILHHLLS